MVWALCGWGGGGVVGVIYPTCISRTLSGSMRLKMVFHVHVVIKRYVISVSGPSTRHILVRRQCNTDVTKCLVDQQCTSVHCIDDRLVCGVNSPGNWVQQWDSICHN